MIKKAGVMFWKEIILVIISVIIGFILLTMVHIIPRERMTGHVSESAYTLHKENWHPQVWLGIDETNLDNTTDSLMINIAYTRSGDSLRDIFLGTYIKVPGVHVLDGLYEVMCTGNSDYKIETYGRYWHGYQVFLCPLLLVMNISEIRQFNTFFQLVLLVFLICLLILRDHKELILPVVVTYFFLCPISLFSSLQYSTSLYVMLFTMIVLLVSKNRGGVYKYIPDIYHVWNIDGIF